MKDSESSKPELGWLYQQELLSSLGVSLQAFNRWGVKPVANIGRRTYYTVKDVVNNRVTHEVTKIERRHEKKQKRLEPETDGTTLDEERIRLTRAQAEEKELKNAQIRGELAPISSIAEATGKFSSQAAAILETIPMKLKRQNPNLTATDIELIKKEIIKIQNIAADVANTLELDESDY